jgi:hypothetical protein
MTYRISVGEEGGREGMVECQSGRSRVKVLRLMSEE